MKPTDTQPDISSVFRQHGFAFTPQRETIWHYLCANPHGHTMSEIVDAMKPNHIGQATVYRTVLLLLDLGLLCRVQHDVNSKTLFLPVHPGHSHPLICRACHQVVEFDSCDLSVLEKLLRHQTGYQIEHHRLEVYGICPSCQSGSGASSRSEVEES